VVVSEGVAGGASLGLGAVAGVLLLFEPGLFFTGELGQAVSVTTIDAQRVIAKRFLFRSTMGCLIFIYRIFGYNSGAIRSLM